MSKVNESGTGGRKLLWCSQGRARQHTETANALKDASPNMGMSQPEVVNPQAARNEAQDKEIEFCEMFSSSNGSKKPVQQVGSSHSILRERQS